MPMARIRTKHSESRLKLKQQFHQMWNNTRTEIIKRFTSFGILVYFPDRLIIPLANLIIRLANQMTS